MDELLPNDDLLVRYLDGELPPDEKAVLEKRLQTDEDLREQLVRLQAAVQAIQQFGTVESVKSVHAEMMRELKPQKKAKVIPFAKGLRYVMGVAAAFLALFIGVKLYQSAQLSPEKLYDEAFVDLAVSTSRSADANLSEIEKRYQQKEYKAVAGSIRSLNLSEKDSLLIGLAYLHTARTAQAIGMFEKLASSAGEFQPDAEFYLSLSYVKEKNYGRALPLLQKIAGNRLHLYHERVSEEMVEKVKKLNNNQ